MPACDTLASNTVDDPGRTKKVGRNDRRGRTGRFLVALARRREFSFDSDSRAPIPLACYRHFGILASNRMLYGARRAALGLCNVGRFVRSLRDSIKPRQLWSLWAWPLARVPKLRYRPTSKSGVGPTSSGAGIRNCPRVAVRSTCGYAHRNDGGLARLIKIFRCFAVRSRPNLQTRTAD